MSIVSAKEIADGRDGSDETNTRGDTHKRTRVFRVVTNNATDTQDLVLAACPLPLSPYPTNPALALTSAVARQNGKMKTVWIVTLTYTLDRSSGRNPNQNPHQPNPIDDEIQVEWSSTSRQELTHQDKDGNAILNSAGQYFENGVTHERTDWVITITQNVPDAPAWLTNYADAVNNDTVRIDGVTFQPYQCKLQGIKIGKWQQRNGVSFRSFSYTIATRPDWRRYILDEGTIALNDNPSDPNFDKLCPAVLANGQKATRPVPLDGTGKQVADPTNLANIYFKTFHLYPEQPFKSLPLPY